MCMSNFMNIKIGEWGENVKREENYVAFQSNIVYTKTANTLHMYTRSRHPPQQFRRVVCRCCCCCCAESTHLSVTRPCW